MIKVRKTIKVSNGRQKKFYTNLQISETNRKEAIEEAKMESIDLPLMEKKNFKIWQVEAGVSPTGLNYIKSLQTNVNYKSRIMLNEKEYMDACMKKESRGEKKLDIITVYNPEGLNFELIRNNLRDNRVGRKQVDAVIDAEKKAIIVEKAKIFLKKKATTELQNALEEEHRLEQKIKKEHDVLVSAKKKFELVYKKRLHAFYDGLEFLARVVDRIYKELTKSPLHLQGGGATLSICGEIDMTEPFNQSVKFTAMPPSKEFRDFDQLSGGEKAVAALALMFARNGYKSLPFFIFDEIDAALDKSNMNKVVSYIQQWTRPTHRQDWKYNTSTYKLNKKSRCPNVCQAIIISHRSHFYSKADALIGISKNAQHESKQSITFDLQHFED